MALKLTDVRRIAGEVARKQNPSLEVVAARAEDNSAYTEVFLTLHGCAVDPCQITLSLSRDVSESEFRQAVDARLREHLHEHDTAQAEP